jgi:very-short-patch-repair endonuclease
MKDRLRNIIETSGLKHYTRAILKNESLYLEVLEATKFLPVEAGIPERVYCVLNDHVANACHHSQQPLFNTLITGYRNFCGIAKDCACRRENQTNKMVSHHKNLSDDQVAKRVAKQKATCLSEYGVENPAQIESAKLKAKKTSLKKHGVDHPSQSLLVKEKMKSTNMARYGVAHPPQLKEIMDKVRATNMDRYGCEHTMSQARQSFAEKNNNKNPFQISEIMDGVSKALSSPDILAKMQDKLFEKHGVRNVMQLDSTKESLRQSNNKTYDRDFANQSHISKESIEILNDELKFKTFIAGKHLRDIATQLGVSYKTAQRGYERFSIPIPKSSYEGAMLSWLQSLGVDCRMNDRMIIKPLELDFIIPSRRIAIEICGLYYHQENNNGKFYHRDKMIKANDADYDLITIFEDEILEKNDIVQARLKHLLGLSERGPGARSLKIETISSTDAKEFFDRFHIQGGGARGFYSVGAKLDGVIVAAMSFCRPRASLGNKNGKERSYELLRFATDGRSYPGAASRLFSRFLKDIDPVEVISYADRRWSASGNLYKQLHFVPVGSTEPNYWYININKITRHYRYKFRKSELMKIHPTKSHMTERAIMAEDGYKVIWDCGNFKFIWNK